ncbi:MAG: glycosyltransferase family 39 protein [Chitinophagaceae bacterium]|nr:glycosyltransferase family 39 protein [Bacteroidota bacterium]MCC6258161.1 glycosyltransferase family 39 protein [Chitinophagaceae bacterium]
MSQKNYNPYLLFLPFLLIYIAYVLIKREPVLWGDEIRHYDEAVRYASGYFLNPDKPVVISNGPGYPLWITFFLLLHIPLLGLKLINAILIYLSIVLLFKTLRYYVSFRLALLISVFWGCYYHNLDFMPYLYAENAAVFLTILLLFLFVKAVQHTGSWKNKYVYFAGLAFGYLALTKVIFGYVMVCMLGGTVLIFLFNRNADTVRKSILICLVGLASVIPYLTLTYAHTGKFFYWATSGGNNLYWMSTPYAGEYGSWFPAAMFQLDSTTNRAGDTKRVVDVEERSTGYIPGTVDSIREHHEATYKDIYRFSGVQRDEAYKRHFFENVKKHPKKYLYNCFSNVGRMLFNFPFTYSVQKPGTLLRIPLNGIIVLFSLLCLVPTFLNWRKINFPARYFLIFSVLYFGGSILGSAEIRMFTMIAPLLLFWIGIVLENFVRIRLKEEQPFNT